MSGEQHEAQRRQYLERMGIDLWLPRQPEALPAVEPAGAPAEPAAAPGAAAAAAPAPAVERPGWEELEPAVASCQRCALHEGCNQPVFGGGDRGAGLLVVAEGPGVEQAQGEPLGGATGALLDNMLRALGLAREQVFITSIVKCRPPNDRDPLPAEAAACMPYLQRQIELLQPRVILALGPGAAHNLLASDESLARLRGQPRQRAGLAAPVVVSYHPDHLLRAPRDKALAWQDLKQVAALLRPAAVDSASP